MAPSLRVRPRVAVLALAALALAPPTRAAGERLGERAAAQIAEIGRWKAALSPVDRRIDSRLLFALDRSSGRLASSLATVEALPLDDPGGVVLDVDLLPGADATRFAAAIRRLGGEPISLSTRLGAVRARLRPEAIRPLAALPGVRRIVPAREAYTVAAESGAIVSEGDRVHRADEARNLFGLSGAGTRVCVLSNGVGELAFSQETGELPAVDVLPGQQGSGSEGTAMLEIVHDVAPGAALGFATAFGGMESFADNILALAATGCEVIVDDVIYLAESPFQDSPVAAAADEVAAAGVLYLSSAGNNGNLHDGTSGTWEGDFVGNGTIPDLPGLVLHDFGDGGVSNLVVDSAPAVVLHWTDPFTVAANDYDLFVLSNGLSDVLRFSADVQDGVGGDDYPVELVSFFGTGAGVGERIVVGRAAGADRMIAVAAFRGELERAMPGAIRGHAAAVGAIAVAAAPAYVGLGVGQPTGPWPEPYDASQASETFTSDGPRRIYFDAGGAFLPAAPPGDTSASGGVVRDKPDLAGADGVSTSVPGFQPFFGTSAAAPHVAALAALYREALPGLDAAALRDRLVTHALDIELPGHDRDTGHGLVRTVEAFDAESVARRANLELDLVTPVEVAGGGDGVLDPGESHRLEIRLVNVGGAGASAIAGTLVAGDPAAEVIESGAAWPDLGSAVAAGAIVTPVVRFAPDAPCGAIVPFTLTVVYAGGIAPESFAFALVVGAAGEPVEFSRTGPPVPIPDSPQLGVSGPPAEAELFVSGLDGRIADLDFRIDGESCTTDPRATTVGVSHGFVSNLLLELVSPAGTTVPILRFVDGFGNNFCQTLLDDESAGPSIDSVETSDNPFSGSYTPSRPLARFDGEDPNGVWTLRVTDWNQSDTGTLRAFSLRVAPAACRFGASVVEVPATSPGAALLLAAALAAAAIRALARR
jgi:hypothetical protein